MTKVRAAVLLVLTSAIATSVAGAAGGEALLRYRERNRSTVPSIMAPLFYRHERLRSALVRDSRYYRWVTVDEHGFRGPSTAVKKTKPANTFRIMVVGGSTVFDSYVSRDDRAWPARLEHALRCASSGQTVEVINAGVPGYVMVDNLIRLQTQLYEFAPDLLILYQAHNDLLASLHRIPEINAAARMPHKVAAISPWKEWLEHNSMLYAKVAAKMKGTRRQTTSADTRTTQPAQIYLASIDAGAARHEKDLRSFLVLAQSFGIKVVVPEIVHIGNNDPTSLDDKSRSTWLNAYGIPPEHTLAGYYRYEHVTMKITHDLGVKYLPLRDAGLGAQELYADGDPIHFNDEGADRMGAWMARSLMGAGVIPTEVTGSAATPVRNDRCQPPQSTVDP
ncbi:MAG: SGNH/GDSL hydrolase family protein [Longimicrobiales bacterium]